METGLFEIQAEQMMNSGRPAEFFRPLEKFAMFAIWHQERKTSVELGTKQDAQLRQDYGSAYERD
jgi:hypothetical protein